MCFLKLKCLNLRFPLWRGIKGEDALSSFPAFQNLSYNKSTAKRRERFLNRGWRSEWKSMFHESTQNFVVKLKNSHLFFRSNSVFKVNKKLVVDLSSTIMIFYIFS